MVRKTLLVFTALLILGAWAGLAMSADPPGLPKGAPQVAPPPEMMRATGTVEGYIKGKNIQITNNAGTRQTFSILADTVIEGKVKKGVRVTVIYEKQEDKWVANKIIAASR
ncbi:hypothetical protein ACFL4N_01570 [Thermodesulfobacteriota bacterium]